VRVFGEEADTWTCIFDYDDMYDFSFRLQRRYQNQTGNKRQLTQTWRSLLFFTMTSRRSCGAYMLMTILISQMTSRALMMIQILVFIHFWINLRVFFFWYWHLSSWLLVSFRFTLWKILKLDDISALLLRRLLLWIFEPELHLIIFMLACYRGKF